MMLRSSLMLVFGLWMISNSIASSFESDTELTDAAIDRVLYDRYLLWKSDQPADGDNSFPAFYDSILGDDAEKQIAKQEINEQASEERLPLDFNNGELENQYPEWKKIQPEGDSVSADDFLGWLKEQRIPRELDEDLRLGVKRGAATRRRCYYGCSCCPFKCGFLC